MKALSRIALLLMFAAVFVASCGGPPPDVVEKQGAVADFCTSWGWCEQCSPGCSVMTGGCPDGCRWANPPPITYSPCKCGDTNHYWCDPNPANCVQGQKVWPEIPACTDVYSQLWKVECFLGGPTRPTLTGGGLLAQCNYFSGGYNDWRPIFEGAECSYQAPNRITGQTVMWRCVNNCTKAYSDSYL